MKSKRPNLLIPPALQATMLDQLLRITGLEDGKPVPTPRILLIRAHADDHVKVLIPREVEAMRGRDRLAAHTFADDVADEFFGFAGRGGDTFAG